MKTKNKGILWFSEVGKGDISLVGGKGANLGEMTQAGIPVPPGFVVTADSYYAFLEKTRLTKAIKKRLQKLDRDKSEQLEKVASEIKEMIYQGEMPREVVREIKEAYKAMGGGLVAVRSSATAEDMPEASFAGQQSTFLNIEGEDNVVSSVQACWASLFEPRAIFYREEQGYDHLKVGIAVPVQKMIQSEISGVAFTVDPMNNDVTKIIIEAGYGLGETIVSGAVTPDLYVLDKKTLSILDRKISRQEWKLIQNPSGRSLSQPANTRATVPVEQQENQKLDDEAIVKLAQICKGIEEHYGNPQDIEWAKENGDIYIVQTRPVTALREPDQAPVKGPQEEVKAKVLLTGTGASPGVGSGPAKVIHAASEIYLVEAGDVLVTELTTPDFAPAMKRACAIVTDRGGRTCHAAIVSRELGIPCVVGTDSATRILRSGTLVTVDGRAGKVYEGMVSIAREAAAERRTIRTATKLYVNLAEPDLAESVAAQHVDGVGLLRAEFIIAQIGEHPRYMLHEKRGHEFTEKLAQGLLQFAQAFYPRPVVYRTTDFKTNEYRHLIGGEQYEEEEENPMLGYRGASRYVSELDVFRLETEAIKQVRDKCNNLWVMVPFVRTPEELDAVKAALEAEGLRRSDTLKLWMMAEIPSNFVLLDKFIDVGIDGISIGSNDLTQLVLGVDRDNAKIAGLFDERDEAVMWALEKIVTGARARGVSCSICGQAPSFFPELTQKLVEWGITSISVSPDMIYQTREIIARVEERLGILPSQGKS